jgi:hypothetical protein
VHVAVKQFENFRREIARFFSLHGSHSYVEYYETRRQSGSIRLPVLACQAIAQTLGAQAALFRLNFIQRRELRAPAGRVVGRRFHPAGELPPAFVTKHHVGICNTGSTLFPFSAAETRLRRA